MTDQQNQDQQNQDQQNQDWRTSLPESVQDWAEVKQAENPEAFWQRMGEQRAHLGNSIRIPSQEASSDDWSEFNRKIQERVPGLMKTPDLEDAEQVDGLMAKLGRPEKAEGYGEIEGDNISFQEGQLDSLKSMALEAGLTRKQFEKFAKQVGQDYHSQTETMNNLKSENLEVLKKEWGLSAEGKYQETLNFAKAVGAPQAIIDGLESRSMQAETVFWLSKMAENAAEGTQVSFQKSTSLAGSLTPQEAQEQIDEILRNFDHPYHNGVESARVKMHNLMKLANPQRYA